MHSTHSDWSAGYVIYRRNIVRTTYVTAYADACKHTTAIRARFGKVRVTKNQGFACIHPRQSSRRPLPRDWTRLFFILLRTFELHMYAMVV